MPIEIGISTTIGGIAGNTPGGGTVPFTNTKSILLDGVDDYVTMGDVLDTSDTGADAFSISAWYKTSNSGTQMIVAKWSNASPINGYALFLQGSSQMRFFMGSFVGNAYLNVTSNTTSSFTDGNWHHVVLAYDGSRASSGIKIYVDTSLITLNTLRDVAPVGVNNSQEFMIGVRGEASNNAFPFDGNIDEVSYFNSELSASDVTSIYNSGVPNDISSLSPLSWWRCGDGDTAPTLTDNGSGGNNGTMQNFSTFSSDVPAAPSFTNTKSIALDGVDDFVDCGNITSLNNVNAFTTSAWFKQNSIDVFAFLFGSYVTAGNWLGVYTFTDGNLYVHFKSSGVDAYGYFDYSSVVSASAWFNLAIVFDGSGASNSDRLKVYVNGSNQSLSFTGTIPTSTVSGANDFEIARLNTYTQVWNGSQDEVSIFNTALTQTNINTIYGSGVPNDLASLSPVHWWRCGDGDTSPTLTDNGSGGNNGTMTNFSTFSTDVPT